MSSQHAQCLSEGHTSGKGVGREGLMPTAGDTNNLQCMAVSFGPKVIFLHLYFHNKMQTIQQQQKRETREMVKHAIPEAKTVGETERGRIRVFKMGGEESLVV